MIDLHGCNKDQLNDMTVLEGLLRGACFGIGATVMDTRAVPFHPQGCSVVCILGESHASLHTYPEHGVCMIDVFTCGDAIDPMRAIDALCQAIPHNHEQRRLVLRGQLSDPFPACCEQAIEEAVGLSLDEASEDSADPGIKAMVAASTIFRLNEHRRAEVHD